MCIIRALVLGLAVAAAFGCATLARADGQADASAQTDLDHIRDLVRAGKLLPLTTLRAQVLKQWPGELIGVTVGGEHGAILYEFRILDAAGKMVEVEVDAATGQILEVENQ